MAMETTAILRAILYQLQTVKSLDEAVTAVKVMCSKDDIAAVEKEIADLKEKLKNK